MAVFGHFEVENGFLQTSWLQQSCLEFNSNAFRLLKIQNRSARSRDRKLTFSAFDPHLKALTYKKVEFLSRLLDYRFLIFKSLNALK